MTDRGKHSSQIIRLEPTKVELLLGLHPKGGLLALPANIRQGWITDSLANYDIIGLESKQVLMGQHSKGRLLAFPANI